MTADAFARYGLWAAWLTGLVGIVAGGDLLGLCVPAGVLLVVVGILLVPNIGRFLGSLMSLIGVAWVILGIAQLAS